MNSMFLTIIHLLLIIKVVVGFNVDACSRQDSLIAEMYIKKYILPMVNRYQYQLPKNCPLNLVSSRYFDQNKHKKQYNTHYRCGYCGKKFRNEFYLERHFDNKHGNALLENSICIANIKDIFSGVISKDIGNRTISICDIPNWERKYFVCQKTVSTCFPPDSSKLSSLLYNYMTSYLCHPLNCNAINEDYQPEFLPYDDEKNVFMVITVIIIIVLLLLILVLIIYKIQMEWSNSNNSFKPSFIQLLFKKLKRE
ncbi:hypothetical protein WA158_003064 [Blastocystis sp. Blastoise]